MSAFDQPRTNAQYTYILYKKERKRSPGVKINTNEFDRLVCSIVDSVPTEHPYLISIKIIKTLDFLYIVSQFVLESSTKRKRHVFVF